MVLRLGPLLPLALALLTLQPSEARAERWFGIGAGVASTLAPADRLGGWVEASAATGPARGELGSRMAARGTLVGLIGRQTWAVMPILGGDAGIQLGPIGLQLSGGVQIFGGARRDEWTVFATFGLMGGGGISVVLGDDLRLCARGQVIWLPSSTTAKIEGPDDEGASKPTFLFASGALVLELRRDFDDNW